MTIQDSLTKEIIHYILANLGLVPPPILGTFGIIDDKFKSSTIKFENEDGSIDEFPIYSATANIDSLKIRVVGFPLFDGIYEFSLLIKVDNLPIYGFKQTEDGNDIGIFLISRAKGSWIRPSMHEKIIACAGIEKLNDVGVIWQAARVDDLYSYLVELVEMM